MAKTGYKVIIHSDCYDSEYSSEKYGDWSESWTNYFGSIHKLAPGQYGDVNSDFDFTEEEKVYVVWVEYSTGDSFGWAKNGCAVAVGVFRTYKDAQALETWIKNKEKSYGSTYDSPDGQVLDVYCEWEGYFENLETVNIEQTFMFSPVK
jgi:hypothetical protein